MTASTPIVKLEGIQNFRDVATLANPSPTLSSTKSHAVDTEIWIHEKRLYRSGHCLTSTESDADLIIHDLGIQTIIDLRRGDKELLRHHPDLFGDDCRNRVTERCERLEPFVPKDSPSRHVVECSERLDNGQTIKRPATSSRDSAATAFYVPIGNTKS